MEAVDVRGRFVWHELMTRDVTAAKNFYSRLAGWKPQAWPLDPNYTVNHSEHGPQSGIFAIPADMPAEMPAHWVNYIGTRDVDATAEAAVRAGGSIVKAPDDIKGAGRYSVLKDPQGALFAILDPENARPEAAGPPPAGSFSWHELATSDNEAAFAFYSGLFGWDAMQRMDMGPMGIYLVFGSNGVQRGGMYIKPPDMPAPPNWLPYVCHASADEALSTAVATGGKAMLGPMDVPGGGRIAVFMDPTGAACAVHSLGAAVEKPAARPAKAAAPKPASQARTNAPSKAKAKTKAKAKAKAKSKASAKTKSTVVVRKPKASPRKKKAAARKPAPKKKVMKKSARRTAAKKKSKGARSKK